ncbi:MAG: hypothetical protein ACRD2A_22800, partial [Vicinamibacterales bacterium]
MNALFALVRRKIAGNGDDFDASQFLPQLIRNVFRRRDETTEQNRMETFVDQLAHDFDGVLKLLILRAHQSFGLSRHFEQPAPILLLIISLIARIAAVRQVGALDRFVVGQIEHGAAANRVG